MDTKTIRQHVKAVLVSRFELGLKASEIADDEIVFNGGLGLDSMAALDLVVGLEEAFDVVIRDDDLTEENFRTVDAVSRLVAVTIGVDRG